MMKRRLALWMSLANGLLGVGATAYQMPMLALGASAWFLGWAVVYLSEASR